MRGQSVLMAAAAVVKKNTRYKIRFAVGDTYDGSNDSAIFLASGSFVQEISLGDPRPICSGGSLLLDTQIDSDLYEHVWRKNGVIIPNETKSTVEIYGPGSYSVLLSDSAKICEIKGEIEIVEPSVSTPIDLESCQFNGEDYVFDLSENSYELLNVDQDIYSIKYYDSLDTNPEGVEIQESQLTNYKTKVTKQIAIKVFDRITGSSCGAFQTFELRATAFLALPDPNPISHCDGKTVNLTENMYALLMANGLDQRKFNITFYLNAEDAELEENSIATPNVYVLLDDLDKTFVIRVEDKDKNCINILRQDLEVNFLPSVDQINDLYGCSSVTLPVLNIGDYYSEPNGMGLMFKAGDVLSTSGAYYIYEGGGGLCRNQSLFAIFLLSDRSIAKEHCGAYSIPSSSFGDFYTLSGGANGSGTIISPGTKIVQNQTIYLFEEIEGVACEYAYELKIHPIPLVDSLEDVFKCVTDDPFLLPSLQNGQFFTQANRQGSQLQEGFSIGHTQQIFINAIENGCMAESSFTISFLPIPQVDIFPDIYNCDPFVLPPLGYGAKYYSGPNKTGVNLAVGDAIYENQDVYIYNEYEDLTGSCTNESFFNVAILGVKVDELENVNACDFYILPFLQVGTYYSGSKGSGDIFEPGNRIEESQDIFIYAINKDRFFCDDESVFSISISKTPVLPPIASNVEACGTYSLEDYQLENATVEYFLEANRQHKILPSEYTLTEAGVYNIYVRASAIGNLACYDEKFITIVIQPLAEITINSGIICVDPQTEEVLEAAYLYADIDPQDFTVSWYFLDEKSGERVYLF